MRLHSFHKTNEVRNTDLKQGGQKNTEEEAQSDVKPSESSSEQANKTNSLDNKVDGDLTHSTIEQHDAQATGREDQTSDTVSEPVKQEAPLIPSTSITTKVSGDAGIPDDQSNFSAPLGSIASVPSLESNLLSPFTPKKHSQEEEEVVTDLIQFGDSLEPKGKGEDVCAVPAEAGGDTTPSEKAQPKAKANQATQKERKLSSTRQPSLESDQSAVVCMFCVIPKIIQ